MSRDVEKKVQILYFEGCPNHRETVERVRAVVSELGITAEIAKVEVETARDAERLRFLGSPSVHVDGVDIEPAARGSSSFAFACRTYGPGEGAPPRELIASALREDLSMPPTRGRFRGALASFPAMGALLLPVGICPACWPAYAGFLSSLGLGFLLYEEYLLPIAAMLLTVALGTLLYRAPDRRGYGPFSLGLVASAVALVGKFTVDSNALLYTGFGLLTVAAAWNGWPKAGGNPRTCENCAPQESEA